MPLTRREIIQFLDSEYKKTHNHSDDEEFYLAFTRPDMKLMLDSLKQDRPLENEQTLQANTFNLYNRALYNYFVNEIKALNKIYWLKENKDTNGAEKVKEQGVTQNQWEHLQKLRKVLQHSIDLDVIDKSDYKVGTCQVCAEDFSKTFEICEDCLKKQNACKDAFQKCLKDFKELEKKYEIIQEVNNDLKKIIQEKNTLLEATKLGNSTKQQDCWKIVDDLREEIECNEEQINDMQYIIDSLRSLQQDENPKETTILEGIDWEKLQPLLDLIECNDPMVLNANEVDGINYLIALREGNQSNKDQSNKGEDD